MDYSLNSNVPLTGVQNEVVSWMLKRPSCINACQTGLGKTYTTLTAITHLLLQHQNLVFFVVVPPKALSVFRRELSTKLNIKYSEISSQTKIDNKSRLYLVSNTQLNSCTSLIDQLIKANYKLGMLIDEAHILQSSDNEFTKLIYNVRRFFSVFWLATATPCGNDIYGLFNLMYLVDPKILGTREDFMKSYLITERRRTKKFNPITHRYEFPYEDIVIGTKNLDKLQEVLKDHVIIRQKHYNLEFVYHKCDLDSSEITSYLEASAGLARDTSKKNWAVRLNDLQRVLDNVSEKYSDQNKLTSKEKLLIQVVSDLINEHALLIYTDLIEVVDRLELLLSKLRLMGYNIGTIYRITGSQSFDERSKVEKSLKIGDIVLLTSAGAESINLQKSDSILLYDASFSIKTMIQLFGRITRVDSTYSKQYIHFIEARGTLDTYKRLCLTMHSGLITDLFGEIETLPLNLTIIDGKTQQKLKNKLLWSFKQRRLPTDEEIEEILNKG